MPVNLVLGHLSNDFLIAALVIYSLSVVAFAGGQMSLSQALDQGLVSLSGKKSNPLSALSRGGSDLLQLQLFKHAVQYAVRGPPVHPHIDRVPAAKPFRQPTPLTTLLRHIEDRGSGPVDWSGLHCRAAPASCL